MTIYEESVLIIDQYELDKNDIIRFLDEVGNSTIYDIFPLGIILQVEKGREYRAFSEKFQKAYKDAQLNDYQWIRVIC
jgi:hypothetical protein